MTPLSPCHLCCDFTHGEIVFRWTRRGRIDADGWLASEIPLGEADERYLATLLDGNEILAEAETTQTQWHVEPSLIEGRAEVQLRVSQISLAVGPGIAAMRSIQINT